MCYLRDPTTTHNDPNPYWAHFKTSIEMKWLKIKFTKSRGQGLSMGRLGTKRGRGLKPGARGLGPEGRVWGGWGPGALITMTTTTEIIQQLQIYHDLRLIISLYHNHASAKVPFEKVSIKSSTK